MRRLLFLAALLALGACGGDHGAPRVSRSDADNSACALLGDGAQIFGAGAEHFGYPGLDGMEGTCQFSSADGKRGGDVILYTPASLGRISAEAQMNVVTTAWSTQTDTALATIDGLGDAAEIATDLPGGQTQIAFRKGGSLVLIAGRSGDSAVSGERLARSMATTAVAALAAP